MNFHKSPSAGDDRPGWRSQTVLAIAVFLLSAVAMILMRPLLPIDETRYLTVAWEMSNDRSWIVPHLNGEIYSHKPPMLFWIINLVWSVAGVGEFAARLVGPAFGAVCIGLTAALARALWPEDPERAGRAALILATTGVFLLYGSATMFDALLGAAALLALLAVWKLASAPHIATAAALGAALAFGALAKGPVILAHVLPAALLMPLWADPDKRAPLRSYFVMVGLSLVVAVLLASLWLGPAMLLGDSGYRQDILWRQTAGRMVSSFAHDRPVWFFAALVPVFLWPWGWSRAGLGALGPKRQWSSSQGRFLLVAAGSAFVIFSAISGKQAHYLLPELPLLALILSGARVLPGDGVWRLPPVAPAVALVICAALLVSGVLPATLVEGNRIGDGEVLIALAVAALSVWLALRVRRSLLAWATVAPLTLIVMHILAFVAVWETHDPARIGALLSAEGGSGVVTTDRKYAGQFSFSARLTEPVALLRDAEEKAAWIDTKPGGLILSRKSKGSEPLELLLREEFNGDAWSVYRVAPARSASAQDEPDHGRPDRPGG